MLRRLNQRKLYVEQEPDIKAAEPIIGRRYTLTHSDITGELFLHIGTHYNYQKVDEKRDEVLAEWRSYNGIPFLYVYVYVDGEGDFDFDRAEKRDEIFRKELPLALEAIRFGDRKFFYEHTDLDNAQIWIQFGSQNSTFNKFENYGNPKDYYNKIFDRREKMSRDKIYKNRNKVAAYSRK